MIDRAGNTFAEVMQAATDEWRLVFARLVREYFDATVLPTPLNVLEIGVNWVMKVRPTIRYTLMNSLPPSLSLSLCVCARVRALCLFLCPSVLCVVAGLYTRTMIGCCAGQERSPATPLQRRRKVDELGPALSMAYPVDGIEFTRGTAGYIGRQDGR
jgi:hypothetical protein